MVFGAEIGVGINTVGREDNKPPSFLLASSEFQAPGGKEGGNEISQVGTRPPAPGPDLLRKPSAGFRSQELGSDLIIPVALDR